MNILFNKQSKEVFEMSIEEIKDRFSEEKQK